MTDEEIIKAYKCCFIDHIYCDDCPCDDWGCGVQKEDILGVVQRLQDENAEQKAEIEQLKEERAWWKEKCSTLSEDYESLKRDTDRIEFKLSDEYKKNAELQKQVDELKEQRDVFKRLFESVNTSNFSTNSIIETMNSFYREQAEHLAGLRIEQAVKDTAKDVYEYVLESLPFVCEGYGNFTDDVEIWLKERYGVEV